MSLIQLRPMTLVLAWKKRLLAPGPLSFASSQMLTLRFKFAYDLRSLKVMSRTLIAPRFWISVYLSQVNEM